MTFSWITGCVAAALLTLAGGALAQQPAAPAPSGRELLVDKCFQCHQDNTWRDGKKTKREWEATLYRMVGRGALWTTEEIQLMAGYLEEDYGPTAAKPVAK
jgi:mono/diheme cytochrome c family protein